ncbi:bifunctional 3-(3-hydroxy-phenyl)propionate/3-hydroxycinnamic acid hydroxylase [Comamonas sp. J-3]|uniref:bifunctional 3-(3-hydroxy-phenyl)propionate/3-hydroxycinnamic acid hydroxylase n=1 Tax=Comamonas trifloxystrobinivorans TaxID=3350256 RepID=UPI00372A477F
MNQRFDVAIIGNGPAGKLLSILLAQQGLQVAVLDRFHTVYPLPRAIHFDDEVGRMLDQAGIGDAAKAICIYRNAPAEFLSGQGEVLIRLESQSNPEHRWPQRNFFHQPQLEAIMQQRAAELANIHFIGGVEAFAIEEKADHAEVRFHELNDSSARSLQARYVVGCDGANSFVKAHIGGGDTGLDFEHDWLVADFTRANADAWPDAGRQYCRPERPTTYVPMGPTAFRMEFMLRPGERREDFESPAALYQMLRETGLPHEGLHIVRQAIYTFRARWRNQWRKGRVFIAGDAAHLTPPFLGQGLCAGARDAVNLAWKLPLVLQGKASEQLLDSYASERIPHAQALIEGAVEYGHVICVRDPQQARQRDADMLSQGMRTLPSVPRPLLGPGVRSQGSALAGTLLPQFAVDNESRKPNLDRWLSGISLISQESSAAATEAAGPLGRQLGLTIISAQDTAPKTQAALLRWLQDNGCQHVLVRPDFYIYGSANSPAELQALLQQLQADLGSTTAMDRAA